MKYLLSLIGLLIVTTIQAATPTASIVPYFSYFTDYFAQGDTSTGHIKQYSRPQAQFYAQDTIDKGENWAEVYGWRIYRIRNTWANMYLTGEVNQKIWWDSDLIYNDYVDCGGSCAPDLSHMPWVGGFGAVFTDDPQWGTSTYNVNINSGIRIQMINGVPGTTYYIRISVGVYEITDRTPEWGNTVGTPVPYDQVRVSGGYTLQSDGTVVISVPGNGALINVTPYCYPTRAFIRYNVIVSP